MSPFFMIRIIFLTVYCLKIQPCGLSHTNNGGFSWEEVIVESRLAEPDTLKICQLRQAGVIDELFESFFEHTGKEVGFPMSIGIKNREGKEYNGKKNDVWVWALMHVLSVQVHG